VLGSLLFEPDKTLLMPLPQDYVDVRITAVRLAYDDLEVWSSRVDTTHFLFEFAGIVTATGSAVNDLNVEDCVCGLSSGQSHVGNSARVLSALVLRLQGGDDAVIMATLPWSYSTVIYALEHIAHLSPERWTGKSLLAQSATTHTGIAAIILAKAKDTDVFATVNTPNQEAFLAIETGIASASLPGAVNATKKGGFDVILSTAPEDLDFLHMTPHYLQTMVHLIHMGQLRDKANKQLLRLT
jgi:NADPH:quinone reductase-like Zn-dependent oxidoreductase